MLFPTKNTDMIHSYETEGKPIPVPMDYVLNDKMENSLKYLLQGLRNTMKAIVKEAVEEILLEQNYRALDEDRTLTSKELCQRWNISSNTLRNWEIDKKISPLPLNGRRKLYSMKDIHDAEAAGYIKRIA